MTLRLAALFFVAAVLLIVDVWAVYWLDTHEFDVAGLALALLLSIWLGVLLSDPSFEPADDSA